MIMAMIRPETEMKDTGIEWIGNIPSSWVCCKQKYVISLINGRAFKDTEFEEDGKYRILRVGNLFSNPKWYSSNLELEDDKYCDNGDLLYAWSMSYGPYIWNGEKVIYHYHIWKAKLLNNLSKRFAYYYLIALSDSIKSDVHETTMSFITMKSMNNSYIAFPEDIFEQQAIADYLDETCSKIDEIIAEAKASIDEYKELKQSVIFEAVTKGLDKNVEMKQCSVNWLDEIPSTWESIRLKYLLTEINNRSETGTEQPLSVSQVMGVVPSYMIAVANPTASYVGQKIVEPNDIVFNKLKAHLGVFFMSKYHGLVSPDYAVYRTNDKVIPKYLEYLFHTSACISEFKKYISGVAEGLMRLYTSDLFNIRICLPKVDEQIKIVEYVENKVELFDSLIAEKESLINDLESYKKSLIYEVVTGKRRVV